MIILVVLVFVPQSLCLQMVVIILQNGPE